ncbi:hypothetical protein CHS0354_036634 [Potamilus streckersoni]|uniref:Major facilitator superfamily (MFS) profile domain-containing protein n=1 Tax=Potamilus streckersoni TaxID=2493646 RepID=A0AAE0SRH4_9BIVA|nr:hypothetical protein CHS0354_036634 [Potamilus streckersoni]
MASSITTAAGDSLDNTNNGTETHETMQNGLAPLLGTDSEEIQLDDVLAQLKVGLFQWKMLLLAGGGYLAVCSEIMVFVFLSEPVTKEWNLMHMTFAMLPFVSGITGIIGSFTFGIISDRFGRQKPFIIAVAIVAVFGLISAFSPTFWSLVLIRSLVSLGNGGLEAVDFVLLLGSYPECLPRRNRGTFMVVITFCGALGAVLAGGLAWWLLPTYGWRTFVGACSIPSFLVFICRFFISYESPRYLFVSGKKKEALHLLSIIAQQNKTSMPTGEIICPSSQERGKLQELFKAPVLKRTIFSSLVWFFQSAGFWGVTIYLPEYMGSLGINPYFNMFTVFIGELPGLFLAMILIEPHMLGRIKCLRFFSMGTIITLVLFAFINLDFLKAVCVIVVYFFMVPIYSILNTYTSEVYPTDIRSIAMAWVKSVISVPGLITPFVGASILSSNISWLYPIVWACCFVLQFLCTFGFSTETAGKDLRDSRNSAQNPSRLPTTRF